MSCRYRVTYNKNYQSTYTVARWKKTSRNTDFNINPKILAHIYETRDFLTQRSQCHRGHQIIIIIIMLFLFRFNSKHHIASVPKTRKRKQNALGPNSNFSNGKTSKQWPLVLFRRITIQAPLASEATCVTHHLHIIPSYRKVLR